MAIDGTGEYKKIMDAISKAPHQSKRPYSIYIKKGVYQEYVIIHEDEWNIVLIGDGMDITTITGNHSYADNYSIKAATVVIEGQGFIAINLSIENTAGRDKGQAVALRANSNFSTFFRCAFRGYQDTLFAQGCLQFYRECIVSGTVDFIFGYASAIFQNCTILARNRTLNVITANGRNDSKADTGFVFQFCNFSRDSDLGINSSVTYLGRPWGNYSHTVIMQSFSHLISPKWWLPWNGSFALTTLYYGEYSNNGPGAHLDQRVNWPGFQVLNLTEAAKFTVDNFILGGSWLPSTKIPYTGGL